MMNDLAALRLLVDWGADEALADAPVDRFAGRTAPAAASAPTAVSTPTSAPPAQAQARVPQPPRGAAAAEQARLLADAAADLAGLHQALAGFEGCPLRVTATHTVRPAGTSGTGVVLVAEAPGAEDDRTGLAFSGPPGQLLDRVLADAGLGRGTMLMTHLVPWRPPGSRAPNEAEVQACLPFLHRLLLLAGARRLLLLGTGTVRALAEVAEGPRRLRGRWLPVAIPGAAAPAQALVMPPLEQWMRSAATKRSVWADLLELRQSIDDAG